MMMRASSLIAVLFWMVSGVLGQDHLPQPSLLWEAQVGAVLDNNGLFISPDDSIVVVVQSTGRLDAFDALDGTPKWNFVPPRDENKPISCNSGLIFCYDADVPYMAYSVVDDPNNLVPFTRVLAVSPDGELLWATDGLEGVNAGSPLCGFDGRHVYLTHNSNANSYGHFSVIDTFEANVSVPLLPLYSEFNTTNPFSPPGIYHRPAEGHYDMGEGNNNDIVVWAYAPNPTDTTVGIGGSFVFQFPIGYIPGEATSRQSIFWILLGGVARDWQTITPPVLTNYGRSMYWGVSRSQFRSWVGAPGVKTNYFNRAKTSSPAFTRGSPAYQSVYTKPALSSSPTQPMIFCGTAATEFVKMDYLMDPTTAVIKPTTGLVKSTAIVSPDDSVVYFSEYSGLVHQVDSANLTDKWIISNPGQVIDGEMAMHSSGSVLYFGFVSGGVQAYQVASLPTDPPTPVPTASPVAPIKAPVSVAPPTLPPVAPVAPVSPPTLAPVAEPTDGTEETSSASVRSLVGAIVALLAFALFV